MTIDHQFGSELLPTGLRRVRSDDQGIRLDVDTEDHDLGLLRSIAEAVRVDEEAVSHLRQYAEVMNRLDETERETGGGNARHLREEKAALESEAIDLRAEIDRALEWQGLGEGQSVRVNNHDTETLAGALVQVVATRIVAEENAERRTDRLDRERADLLGRTA